MQLLNIKCSWEFIAYVSPRTNKVGRSKHDNNFEKGLMEIAHQKTCLLGKASWKKLEKCID